MGLGIAGGRATVGGSVSCCLDADRERPAVGGLAAVCGRETAGSLAAEGGRLAAVGGRSVAPAPSIAGGLATGANLLRSALLGLAEEWSCTMPFCLGMRGSSAIYSDH